METNYLTVKSAGFHKKELLMAIIFARSIKNIFLALNRGWTEIKCLEVQNVKKYKKNFFEVSAQYQRCKILNRNGVYENKN
jgi:hypothetical protein